MVIAQRRLITIRVPPAVHAGIRNLALNRNVSMQQVGLEILMEELRREATVPGTTFLMPEIKMLLEEYILKHHDVYLRLLARTAIDAGTTKRLMMFMLEAGEVATAEEANELEALLWKKTSRSLHSPLDDIERLLAELAVHAGG